MRKPLLGGQKRRRLISTGEGLKVRREERKHTCLHVKKVVEFFQVKKQRLKVMNIPKDVDESLVIVLPFWSMLMSSFPSIGYSNQRIAKKWKGFSASATADEEIKFYFLAMSSMMLLKRSNAEMVVPLNNTIRANGELPEENKRLTSENADFRAKVSRVKADVDQQLKEKDDESVKLRVDLEEYKWKLSLASTEVEHLVDINENIELDTSVKVHAEIMEEYLNGKVESWDPHKALRQWEEMQRIINEGIKEISTRDHPHEEKVVEVVD